MRPSPRPAAEQEDLGFLDTVEHRRAFLEQVITQDVNVGLRRAHDMMASDPKATETDLKLLLDRVSQAPELSPGLRSQLHNRLVDAIREADRRSGRSGRRAA